MHTYYEVTGSGPPLVLLHGGLATIEGWFAQTPVLAEHYRVFLPERRGHGRTADVDGPISYQAMAEDTAAFLDAVGVSPAHLVGWSDGAVVAALVALQRPELVGKLVLIGQWFNLDGQHPATAKALLEHPEFLEQMARPQYDAVSPDGPEHFPVVLDKMLRMWRTEPNLDLALLAGISAPTLVMQGDHDMVTVEHGAELAATLPDAQFAVLPGTTHGAPIEKPDLVNKLILDFLADEQPRMLMALPD